MSAQLLTGFRHSIAWLSLVKIFILRLKILYWQNKTNLRDCVDAPERFGAVLNLSSLFDFLSFSKLSYRNLESVTGKCPDVLESADGRSCNPSRGWSSSALNQRYLSVLRNSPSFNQYRTLLRSDLSSTTANLMFGKATGARQRLST